MRAPTRLLIEDEQDHDEQVFGDAVALLVLLNKGDDEGVRALWSLYRDGSRSMEELCNLFGSIAYVALSTCASLEGRTFEDLFEPYLLHLASDP